MDSEKITYSKIVQLAILLIFGVLFFECNTVDAATLQINSGSATLSPGSITTLSVILDSEGVAINNAEAKIIFPVDLLEVVSVSKSNSVFSLWVEEPTFSNASGILAFNGGVPTPGFTGPNGIALSVVVKAKTAGQADLIFSDAAVRANDGLGTDVLRTKTGKTLTIIQKEEPSVKPTEIEIETPRVEPSTIALRVTSPTHPSQELWYTNNKPTFNWKVPSGVDAIQTGIDNHTSGSPRVTFSPAISKRTVADQEDGVWYFKVRARKNEEWGPISTYIVRIDNTIPQKNEVTFAYDENTKILTIEADIIDETSGLDYYEIFINDVLVKEIPSEDFVNGTYGLAVDSPGDNTVKLVAVDRAGNSVESLGSFNVKATPEPILELAPEPIPVPAPDKPLLVSVGPFTTPAIYLVSVILFGIIILVLGAFGLGRSQNKSHNKLKMRAALAKGDNAKMLLFFKKRLEKHLEILQRTRHIRMLSKEEKEIKQAIEEDLDEIDRAIEEYTAGGN